MTTDVPDAAVEAAARRLCAFTSDDESGWYCETHGNEIHVAGLYYCATGEDDARAALTAAAPHIAERVTGALLHDYEASARRALRVETKLRDLRARIKALCDEWRKEADRALDAEASWEVDSATSAYRYCGSHAAALDALIGGAQ